MEQQEKTFRADREDLMKMLAGFESGLLPIPGKPGEQLDKVRCPLTPLLLLFD